MVPQFLKSKRLKKKKERKRKLGQKQNSNCLYFFLIPAQITCISVSAIHQHCQQVVSGKPAAALPLLSLSLDQQLKRFPHPLYSIHILSLKTVINHFKHNNPFKNGFYRQRGTPLVMWLQSSDAPTFLKHALYGVDINDAARLGEAITGGMSQLSPMGTSRFQGVSIGTLWNVLFY